MGAHVSLCTSLLENSKPSAARPLFPKALAVGESEKQKIIPTFYLSFIKNEALTFSASFFTNFFGPLALSDWVTEDGAFWTNLGFEVCPFD